MNPIVSVRIMAYQNAPYIKECIDSVLMQKTDFPFEICIGEDGSTDGTREICLDYQDKYPDIVKVFLWDRTLPEHKAMPPARYNFINTIKKCQGKYIALLDGDDYWTDPLKLFKQVNILEQHPSIVLCHHWHKFGVYDKYTYKEQTINTRGQGYLKNAVTTSKELFTNDLRIKIRTMLFRNIFSSREIPDFFYKAKFGDLALAFILGKEGEFYFIDEEMAVYRQLEGGILNKYNQGKTKEEQLENRLKDLILVWDLADSYYDSLYESYYKNTVNHFYRNILLNQKNSIKVIIRCIIHNIRRITKPDNKWFQNRIFFKILLLRTKYFLKNVVSVGSNLDHTK
jgi:glycosyltransferase involved in cell wall biosynthesis